MQFGQSMSPASGPFHSSAQELGSSAGVSQGQLSSSNMASNSSRDMLEFLGKLIGSYVCVCVCVYVCVCMFFLYV